MPYIYSKLKSIIHTLSFQNNLWTLLSSGASAVYSALLVLVTVRFIGVSEAGVVSLAIAIAGIFQVIVTFGIRPYQSTDIRQEFAFQTYFTLRVISTCVATFFLVALVVFGRLFQQRTIIVLLVFLIFLIDGFSDVYMGEFQQKGNMRIAGYMRVCAFSTAFLAYCITLIISKSIIMSLIASGSLMLISYSSWIFILFYRRMFTTSYMQYSHRVIVKLLSTGFPLFAFSLINYYIYNLPKYILGFIGSDEDVAIISMLGMPMTLFVMLCNSFFMGAEMTKTATIYSLGNVENIVKRIKQQMKFCVALSAFYLVCNLLFGIPLLSWIYSTDFSQYKQVLILLALSGALVPFYSCMGTVLIVLRMQKAQFINIAVIAVITGPIIWWLTSLFGINGAAASSLIQFFPYSISSYCIYLVSIKKKCKAKEKE